MIQLPEKTLAFPEFVLANATYSSVTLSEPKLKHMKAAQKAQAAAAIGEADMVFASTLISEVAGKKSNGDSVFPRAAVDELPMSVVQEAIEYLMGFINPGQQTGTN